MSGEQSKQDKKLAELYIKQGLVPGTPLSEVASAPLMTTEAALKKQKIDLGKKTIQDLGELFYDPVGNNMANLDVEKFARVRTNLKSGQNLSISERIFLLKSLSYKLEPDERKSLLQKQSDFGKYGIISGLVGLGTGIMFNVMFRHYIRRSFFVKLLCFTPVFCFSVYFQLSPLLIDYSNFTENLQTKYKGVLEAEVDSIHEKIQQYDGWSKKGLQKIRALQLQQEKENNQKLQSKRS